MSKGIEFEERALIFLKALFEKLGFRVTEARQQETGTQNGFDLKIRFLDDTGKERKFYFECKDYRTRISWNDIAVKIHELHASNHHADGFIALSPHMDFSNIHINVIAKLSRTLQTPIVYWTPESNVKLYFSLDEDLYMSLYGNRPGTSEEEKASILQKIRHVIVDMLHQKDELAAKPSPVSFPKELTLKIPRIDNDDIVGRATELEELHQLLFSNKKVVVVNGLGGIGKTALAQGYLSKFYNEYKHIVWISQLTKDIVSDIANTERLIENLGGTREGKDTKQLFDEIISKLKAIPDSPNLLIFDNTDEELAKLKDYLPGQPYWHVLSTSRKRIEGFYAKELDFLPPEKAIALFKKHCARITNDEQIAELVKVIDYHTLTIEILAKTAEWHRTDIEKLKKAIKDDLRANAPISHKGPGEKIDRVRSYLTSIFTIIGLKEDEIWLMKQFTCLPAEFHPYEQLLELIDPDENKKEVFAETCNRLVQQGWLLFNAKTDAYKMHLVVQEVTLTQLLPVIPDIERLLDKVIWKLRLDQTRDNPIDKFKWIPFGFALLNNFRDDMSKMGDLQNNLAMTLKIQGNYLEAKGMLENALRIAERNYGPDHPSTAVTNMNLAVVLQDLGDFAGARTLLEKAVISAVQNFGPYHQATVMIYSNLAIVLKELGDYNTAKALLEKALLATEKLFGPDHPDTALRYSNLAVMLEGLGDYAGARVLMEKSLRSTELHFGANHPTTAVNYSILGVILHNLRDYNGARLLLEKALHSDEQNFGPDHPTMAVRYSNLALVLRDLGDYTEAKALLKKALRLDKLNLGPNHPATAVSYTNLALVLKDLGDYIGARTMQEIAMRISEQNFGADHPSTGMVYMNLASLLIRMGDYTGALELSEKSLSAFKKALPENHPYILNAQYIYDSTKARL
jgi:tetratricopeptide (TPR) repeat protein